MAFLPIFLNIKQRDCLVVGGGQIAARKVALLEKAGARITVIAPELCDELSTKAEADEIGFLDREFDVSDVCSQADVHRLIHYFRISNRGLARPDTIEEIPHMIHISLCPARIIGQHFFVFA